MAKLKTYIALHVPLYRLPDRHRASNGNKQVTIVVRAPSKKAVSDLLGIPVPHLNSHGLHIAEHFRHIAQKDLTVYYEVERPNPEGGQWFEYELPPSVLKH